MGVSTFYDFFSCSFFGLCQCLSFKYVLHTKIYPQSILIYHPKDLAGKYFLAMIPIVNVLVYMDYVVRLKDRWMLDIDYRNLMSYFFRGQMMTTIIRTLYKEKHGKS